MTGSIDKGSAGYHFDVMKFSDIVEENNVRTKEQIFQVNYAFEMAENLSIRPDGWIDVEGTRYSSSDVYGKIIDREEERRKEGKPKIWNVYARGCYKKKLSHPPTFDIDELNAPDLLDEKGLTISWWPER